MNRRLSDAVGALTLESPPTHARFRHRDLDLIVVIEAGVIVDLFTPESSDLDLFATLPFVDLQMNGRWGVSFSDESLSVEEVVAIFHAQPHLGSAAVCPTLITASPEATLHGIRVVMEATRRDSLVASLFAGFHLEGPWISERDGFRGAHPLAAVRDPDLVEFARWFEAAEGRIAIVTLAPEREGSIEAIRALTSQGVVVAVGHSSADAATLKRATDAGATLATHLGNGVASTLTRHPNPIWDQLSNHHLFASFIADGHHVDPQTLWTMMRAKGLGRSIVVSDFSPLAGLPVGTYGRWAVDPSGKIVVAGTPYLAGANQGIREGLDLLFRVALSRDDESRTQTELPAILETANVVPASLIGRELPLPSIGDRANLLFYETVGGRFLHRGTAIGGNWFTPDEPTLPSFWGKRPE